MTGKIALDVAASQPNTVYALIEAVGDENGLYRSDDAGATWRHVSNQKGLLNRPFYYTYVNVDPKNPEMLIAVSYLRMGPWEHTGMSVAAVTRQQFLDDATNNIGETFLATGLTCCRCHDHKFDPMPTRDYYRMQAVLAPACGWAIFVSTIARISSGMVHMPLPICALPRNPVSMPMSTFQSS